MDDGTEIDRALLDRYLAGQCTPAEQEQVERRIADAMHLAFGQRRQTYKTQQAIATLRQRIDRAGAGAEPVVRRPAVVERVGAWRVARIAAAIAVVVGGSLVIWRGIGHAPAGQRREFVSAPGHRLTVTLPDGTNFVLGPASRLTVSADFGRGSRGIVLDGEALFTVVHDTRHPFEVRTSRSTIRDVGTTFAVHAYADDRSDRVAVAEGEVSVSGVAVRASDIASITAGGHVEVERRVDVAPDVEWAQGTLVFRQTPLRDAVRDVARTYDLDIQIADSTLNRELVTGAFGTGQPVEEVVGVMARIVGAHFERSGRTIIIRRGAAPAEGRGTNPDGVVRMTRVDGGPR